MKIDIICVGKIKEKFYTAAVEEYSKRLSRYCQLEIHEVADEKTPDHGSEAEYQRIKRMEGERLLRFFRPDAYVIVLAIDGKPLSSEAFSEKMDALGISGTSRIQFVIGGSLGLSEEVMRRADFRLSFSPMTFPHQLMRVILLEQIYRGYRIMKGEPYHK
ncbi:23S rRNA (pseudouridine(1915)-N(3))-methyltransferase RlmH [Hominifimenecus sp. rT4P-3]|uniref:23S rRNA (pseudouridine(1915)-N(3))-methyltransferase RlmH n=1 Tax=Hominifimenecus sp. rT4P-3 TaxID=3242979 RepID=UPI003DA4AE5C